DVLLRMVGNWRKFLVMDEAGELIGTVSVDALQAVPRDRWATVTVAHIMSPERSLTTIVADQSLLEVVQILDEKKLSALAVRQENGQLLGLLEKQTIAKLLQGALPQARAATAD
ncbi:MAG: CBS domain-containing protein, partial [Cyanobacteria bacterium P01_D01_bin.6]